jgi:hypothetical protein
LRSSLNRDVAVGVSVGVTRAEVRRGGLMKEMAAEPTRQEPDTPSALNYSSRSHLFDRRGNRPRLLAHAEKFSTATDDPGEGASLPRLAPSVVAEFDSQILVLSARFDSLGQNRIHAAAFFHGRPAAARSRAVLV